MVLKLFECFAGYGGASWGLKLANIDYECVGYSEIKKSAIKCYETNFSNTKNFGDITLINWHEVPDFDLLTGGFPCQDVSTQGKQDLSIGRTVLINNLIEALKIKQPKYFLFENVSAIEQEKFRDFLLKVERDLKNSGYQVYRQLLKSVEHGSPQARERVFFIGYRKDIIKPFGFTPYPKHNCQVSVTNDILDKPLFMTSKHRRKPGIIKLGQWKESVFESRNNIIDCLGYYPTLCTIDEQRRVKIENDLYKLNNKELFRLQGFFKDEINISNLSYSQCIDLSGDGWDVNLVKQIFLAMEMV
jgi:DNA (cytosine-5)-methyltransferase 1